MNLFALQKIEREIVNSPSLDRNNLTSVQKKIDTSVLILKEKLAPNRLRTMGIETTPQNLSNDFQKVNEKGQIQLYAKYIDPSYINQLSQDILSAGGKIDLISEEMSLIQCWIPSNKIEEIASKPYVKNMSLPGYAIRRPINKDSEDSIPRGKSIKNNSIKTFKQGSVDSSADPISNADIVRLLGFKGKGIKVGVISGGITDIALSQTSGDIPATYEAESPMNDLKNKNAEGLAMMEIIHDIAPEASLAFSNRNTDAEFIKAIQILDAKFNCNIIVDDVAQFKQPYFEDGEVAKQIITTSKKGKLYISAVGNFGSNSYYEGDFSGIKAGKLGNTGNDVSFNDGSEMHSFDGKEDVALPIFVPKNVPVGVFLQWNDKWGQANSDYDLHVVDKNIQTIEKSENVQDGDDNPFEFVAFANVINDDTAYIVIKKISGINKRLKIITYLPKGYGFKKYSISAGSIIAHQMTKEDFSVGAISLATPEVIESFSSRGPVRIDFPSLEYRLKPDICGIDAVAVTGNGGFPKEFTGTSASAPHVAGLAALLWSANKNLSAETIKSLLKGNAVDLGDAGADNTYGYGRADVYKAYEAYKKLSTTTPFSASSSESLSYVMAYPNPVKLSSDSKSFLFDNLKGDETIRLYTIAGEFVTSYAVQQGNTSWKWDLKNSDSKEIAEGIYLYAISNGKGQRRTGKVVVVN